ncbi:MAG: aminoacetone oxidase family FAD-binding enzyme [Ruminococcus sp.]|nr:aminoacetone oxidase family FAD-binding enzyme [Ruminococcus sp.]
MIDILIIGGGASGLAAAVFSKQTAPDAETVIAERLPRVGKKILATGNGRCNLGNRNLSADNYHGSVDAMDVISRTPSAEEFFRSLGVLTFSDEQGRLYPYSGAAATVLNALRQRAETLGVRVECGFAVSGIRYGNDHWEVTADDGRTLKCRRLIIAAGGHADPKSGTDGTMLRILRDMGYQIAKCSPAVAPLKTDPALLKGLKGIRARCRVQAYAEGKYLHTEEGEIQFTETMLSGICVFNLAYLWGRYGEKLRIITDLAPDMNTEELCGYLREVRKLSGEAPVSELLCGMFRRELAAYITKAALRKKDIQQIRKLTDSDLRHVADTVKGLSFPVTGCAPWQNAQSTCGGVKAVCIGSDMSSKLHGNLWLCGEIADTAGDCGGYNLQWAWSSGILAGTNAALSLKGSKR